MWDEEEDYLTPPYLLWACIALGSILAIFSAGGVIKALIGSDASGVNVALLVLVIFMAFFLIHTGIRALQNRPKVTDED